MIGARFADILRVQRDVLAFRKPRPLAPDSLPLQLAWVFAVALVVGAGRYWDHPSAALWQRLGLGWAAYVVLLSTFLYVIVLPLRPARWSYPGVLVFVGFTALPGLLYAVPVERFLPLDAAQRANAGFLLVVAMWRVALYARYLVHAAGLDWFRGLVATILPLSAIVTMLAVLNLEHVVFDVMAGIRETDRSPQDLAYQVVVALTAISFVGFPVTGILYFMGVLRGARKQRSGREAAADRGEPT